MGLEQLKVQLNPDSPPTGSDLSIVNAARRSFGKRSEWEVKVSESQKLLGHKNQLKEKDKRLIEFLARGMTIKDFQQLEYDILWWGDERTDIPRAEKEFIDLLWEWRLTPTHSTPFNHVWFSFEVQAPIFVARQLVKHEYLVMSEFSRRYMDDQLEFYEPDFWRKQHEDKKQGSTTDPISNIHTEAISDWHGDAERYFRMLVESGVAIEQARMVLPLSLLTSWTWSGTLGAFAKMCTERLSPDAQYETRMVAQQVYEFLKDQCPVGAPALVEGVK